MKRKFWFIALLSLIVITLCGCNSKTASADGSIKEISKPYIAQYECTEAKLGETDILEKYDYIRIILVDNEKLEVCIKPTGGEKKTFEGKYTLDPKTRELEGGLGILGFDFKEKVIVRNGQFEIRKTFLDKLLYVRFEVI